MNLTLNGITYSFANAQDFILHETRLIGEKWGANLDTASVPVFVKKRVMQIVELGWGIAQ